MGIKDILAKARERRTEKKETFRKMDEQMRIQEILEERKKSANERELERFMKEEREKQIKVQLDEARKIRDNDIRFNHNPLDVPNITSSVSWEVMKEKNMFKGNKNMFSNNEFIHKSNNNLLKNNPKLLKNNMRLLK